MRNDRKMSNRTLALIAAAILLFSFSGVMGVRAALTTESEQITSNFGMSDLAVELTENGTVLDGSRDEAVPLNLDHLDKDSDGNIMIKPGKLYKETIGARNASEHDQYVRIIIKKYWSGEEGKDPSLTPDMIELRIGDGWKKSSKESTKETETLYYLEKLPSGQESKPAITGVKISSKVLDAVEINEESEKVGNKTIYTYEYDFEGCAMVIEAELQAVQTHNAKDAIVSVWGNDAPAVGGDGKLKVE